MTEVLIAAPDNQTEGGMMMGNAASIAKQPSIRTYRGERRGFRRVPALVVLIALIAATAIAARFIFKGREDRPGVVPVSRNVDPVFPFSAYWGIQPQFIIPDNLPQMEMLTGSTETPAEVEMYLTKVG